MICPQIKGRLEKFLSGRKKINDIMYYKTLFPELFSFATKHITSESSLSQSLISLGNALE